MRVKWHPEFADDIDLRKEILLPLAMALPVVPIGILIPTVIVPFFQSL